MKEQKNVTISFGGIGSLLTVAFVVLRLCNVIEWPWVWVFAPIWIPFGLAVLLYLIVIILSMVFLKK